MTSFLPRLPFPTGWSTSTRYAKQLRFQGGSSNAPQQIRAAQDSFQSNDADRTPEPLLLPAKSLSLSDLQSSPFTSVSPNAHTINLSDVFGDTPLMNAVGNRDVALARHLITKGAQVNAQNWQDKGKTPLILAILADSTDCVDALLEHPKLDVNLTDGDGNTPLKYAIFKKNMLIVKKLLAHGADPSQANNKGLNPLFMATSQSMPRLLEILLQAGADCNQPDEELDTPLLAACAKGDPKAIELLLKAKANPNQGNRQGMMPLSRVLLNKNQSLGKLLHQYGADPNAQDLSGHTLLTRFCELRETEPMRALLALGADVNLPNQTGVTPLKQAILSGDPAVVKTLLAVPSLQERPQLTKVVQNLKNQSSLTPATQGYLASQLSAPWLRQALQQNPTLNLSEIIGHLQQFTETLHRNHFLQQFKHHHPDAYKNACRALFETLGNSTTVVENSPSIQQPLSEQVREQLGTLAQARATLSLSENRQLPSRLRSGQQTLLSPLSSDTITHNLECRLSELRQARPAHWRQMQVNELYELFQHHESIMQSRQKDPEQYLLACKTFLGLLIHHFQDFDNQTDHARKPSPAAYRQAFKNDITQALMDQGLYSTFDEPLLHHLLTRSTQP